MQAADFSQGSPHAGAQLFGNRNLDFIYFLSHTASSFNKICSLPMARRR